METDNLILRIKNVTSFVYLVSVIEEAGNYMQAYQRRISWAYGVFNMLMNMWILKEMSQKSKKEFSEQSQKCSEICELLNQTFRRYNIQQ